MATVTPVAPPIRDPVVQFGFLRPYAPYHRNAGELHRGVDLVSLTGDKVVRAIAPGTCCGTFVSYTEPGENQRLVIVQHRLDRTVLYVMYGHLTKESVKLRLWQRLKTGDVIGEIDPLFGHVHIEFARLFSRRFAPTTKALIQRWFVDPTLYIPTVPNVPLP